MGLDFGSDSVRALLVDSKNGEQQKTAVCPYRRWGEGRYSDASEYQFRQHPLDYLESAEEVVKELLKDQDVHDIVGIGVDTTSSTPVAVDQNGTPLALLPEFAEDPDAMFLLWKDHSSNKECNEIKNFLKSYGGIDYSMYEGGVYSSEWFWSKALHVLRNNENIRAKAYAFVEHSDWFVAELIGGAVMPGRCVAGHKAMWHESWGGFPPAEFFSKIDPALGVIRQHLINRTYTPGTPAGHLSEKWATKWGLSTDVIVACGSSDGHTGAVGGAIEPNSMVKIMGTSTTDIVVVPKVDRCIPGICGQINGSVIPDLVGLEAGQCAFGDIYAWFQRFVSYGGKVSLTQLEQDAQNLPSGNTWAVDWMNGRRTPYANLDLRGALFGLNLGTTAPMVYRALVESTVFGSRAILDHFVKEGVAINKIIAIGGISKKSKFVMQMCADVLNRKVDVSRSNQTCALGAAMYAAVAAGIYKDVYAAMDAMNSGVLATYTPQKSYDKEYLRYLYYAKKLEEAVCREAF